MRSTEIFNGGTNAVSVHVSNGESFATLVIPEGATVRVPEPWSYTFDPMGSTWNDAGVSAFALVGESSVVYAGQESDLYAAFQSGLLTGIPILAVVLLLRVVGLLRKGSVQS